MVYHKCDFQLGKYWNIFGKMESRLQVISRYILLDPKNNTTYSEELAEFLISIGSSVDSFFRDMSSCPYYSNVIKAKKINKIIDDYNIVDFRKLYEDFFEFSKMHIRVPFGLGDPQEIIPFEKFSSNDIPTWWTNYNDVKHNYMKNIQFANLYNILNALGALFLLNIYHSCSREYLFNFGVYQTINGPLSVEDAKMAFNYTPKGTTGYREGNFVFVRTQHFFHRISNYEPP